MAAGRRFEPSILGFLCNWCCYAGADLAGVSRFQYPPHMRIIRFMCSGRVDPAHIFRAFATGQDAVFIGGCHLNDCHYVTHGNYDALATVSICRRILKRLGLSPERLRLEWVSAGEGTRFAGIMNEFIPAVEALGPLGLGEGLDEEELKSKLEAAARLVPYIKLVQAERLRPPVRTEQAYREFFGGQEFERLFDELIAAPLTLGQVVALARKGPRSAAEISRILGLGQAEASRHLKAAARIPGAGPAAGADDRLGGIIERYRGRPGSLVQLLLEIQREYRWLPADALERIGRELAVPLSRIMQIVTFHKTFNLAPGGRHDVHVCEGPACYLRGSARLVDAVRDAAGVEPGATDPGSRFSLETGSCLGCCSLGPEIVVGGKHHGRLTPEGVKEALKGHD